MDGFRTLCLALALAAATATAAPALGETALSPRLDGAKASLAELAVRPASRQVIVKFKEGRKVRLRNGALTGLANSETSALASALAASGTGALKLRRLHTVSESILDQQKANGERESGRALADLNLYYILDVPAGSSAAAMADRLNRLSFVEFAEPAPVPAPPPIDIPPVTPNLKSLQTYKNPPPGGIGAYTHGQIAGADGRRMRYVDIEYSWQIDHEDLDLPGSRILTGGATPSDPFANTNHGTAVLGEISGKSNNYGVTGIAAKAVAHMAPANTLDFGYNPANAITLAAAALRRGDVIVIEQQYWVCGLAGSSYGPLEWLQSVYDAIAAATANGIIVVAAAGNGNVNLDGAGCNNLFNRSMRDSLAIIVGAGTSTDHSRLSFSSYGSRVDVQAWGHNVATAGYGDAFDPGDIRQRYTGFFSGTSSATPIVSGAVLQIQGVLKACGVKVLRPAAMRTLLAGTGTPQANPATGAIGPLPNIRAALLATNAHDCVLAQVP